MTALPFPIVGGNPNIPPEETPANKWAREHGLTPEDVALLGLRPVGAKRSVQMIGIPVSDGIHIPYPNTDYPGRVRNLSGAGPKYLSGKGSGHAPAFLPPNVDWKKVLNDESIIKMIVEGEIEAFTANKFSDSQGVAVLGIGGVDMIAKLFDGSIDWRGQRVLVGFDKDAGCESGEYTPGVAQSLGKLCAKLGAEGASVWSVCVPGEKEEKVGVGDYLREGGSMETLVKGAVTPPEWCEHMAWLVENCIYVTGTNHTHIYNLEDGSRKSPTDFHDAHIEKRRLVQVDKKAPRYVQISKEWVLLPPADRKTARHYVLNPQLPFGLVGKDLNLWQPYPDWKGFEIMSSVGTEWQNFMEGLFGEHWQWVACWVAHMLNRPEEKAHVGVFVRTRVKGIGKGLFSEIVGKLCGSHYCECKPADMVKQFNAKMEAKTFVAVHELAVTFKISEDEINNLVTSETYDIEQKGKDVITLPDLRRWYLTSNASNPMRMSKDQRRWMVINPPRTTADTTGPWNTFVRSVIAKYKNDGNALFTIREWFDYQFAAWENEHGRWEPDAPPPQTAEGLLLAESSMTSNQIIASEVVEWITANGGIGVVSPSNFKMRSKIFAEVISVAQASGGMVGKKTIKEDGKATDYYIIGIGDDVVGDFEKVPRRTDKYIGTVGNERLVAVGAALWGLVQKQHNQHTSGLPDKF